MHCAKERMSEPLDAPHNLLVLSSPPEASCKPSGEKVVYLRKPLCVPCQTMSGLPCACAACGIKHNKTPTITLINHDT